MRPLTRPRLSALVHRRIFRELLFLFSLCAVALLTLLLIGRLLQLRELFITQSLNLGDLLKLFFYLAPFFLLLIIPIACMLSVFLTFLRMGTDRELTALKASGVSLYQLLPAPAAFCLLAAVATAFVSMFGVSWGMSRFRTTVLDLARTKTQLVLQPGVFNRDFPGLMVFARQVDNQAGVLSEVLVQDRTRKDITATILAPSGSVRTDSQRGEIVFQLENGSIYRQEKEGVSVLAFGEYKVRLDLSKLVHGYDLGEVRPKEMSFTQLLELGDDPNLAAEHGPIFARKVGVETQLRLAMPFACPVLGLFALPMACAFGGLRQQWGLLLAMGFFLFYYSLLSLGRATGEAGSLSPLLGLWLPNLIFALVGTAGLRLTVREDWPHLAEQLSHIPLPGWMRRRAHAG
jgi:lipopolysaccharide export system permease protein